MVPPYFAGGAGAEMRRSVGTAMLWGAFGVGAASEVRRHHVPT